MKEFTEILANNLRFLLKITNTSQTKFANDVGINRGTARKILLGTVDPRITTIKAICDKYSVTYKWLTDRKVGEI